jgi:hypothetical protein
MKTISDIELQIWQLEQRKKELEKQEIDNQAETWAKEILSKGWISGEIVDRIVRTRITQFRLNSDHIPTYKDFQWNGLEFEYDWDYWGTWYNIKKADDSVFTIDEIIEIESYNDKNKDGIVRTLQDKREDLKQQIGIIDKIFLEKTNK